MGAIQPPQSKYYLSASRREVLPIFSSQTGNFGRKFSKAYSSMMAFSPLDACSSHRATNIPQIRFQQIGLLSLGRLARIHCPAVLHASDFFCTYLDLHGVVKVDVKCVAWTVREKLLRIWRQNFPALLQFNPALWKITFCMFQKLSSVRISCLVSVQISDSDSIHVHILFHIFIFNRNWFHLTA